MKQPVPFSADFFAMMRTIHFNYHRQFSLMIVVSHRNVQLMPHQSISIGGHRVFFFFLHSNNVPSIEFKMFRSGNESFGKVPGFLVCVVLTTVWNCLFFLLLLLLLHLFSYLTLSTAKSTICELYNGDVHYRNQSKSLRNHSENSW